MSKTVAMLEQLDDMWGRSVRVIGLRVTEYYV